MKGRLIYLLISLFVSLFLLSSCGKSDTEEITMTAKVEENAQQIRITGSTNLPNDMELTLQVQRKIEGYEFKSEETVIVKDGLFISSWVIDTKRPYNKLKPGEYSIQILSKPSSKQPAAVKDIIGEKGKYLQGQLVTDGADGKIVLYSLNTEIKGEDLSKPNFVEEGKEVKFALEEICEGLEKNGFTLKTENIAGNETTVAQDPKELVRIELIGIPEDISVINVDAKDVASDEVKNYFKNILGILFPEWNDSESWIIGYFNEDLAKSNDQDSVGKTINYGNKYITINGMKSNSKVDMSIGPNI